MIMDLSSFLFVLLGMVLGALLGVLGTLTWAAFFTDITHD
jgi:uncharacterized protein involved in exopolysaccharide biosynthesis